MTEIISIFTIFVLSTFAAFSTTNHLFNNLGRSVTPLSGVQSNNNSSEVLGDSIDTNDSVTFNVDAIFNKALIIKGKITADNIVYGIKAGVGVGVDPRVDPQNPIITNTGVLSLAGKTGELKLEQGSGITIDGLKITNSGIISLTSGTGITVSGSTITNSDLGSSQNIFKTISVSGQDDITAGSNTDTLTFAQGAGITLTTDSTNDKLTITSNDPSIAGGWTHAGTDIHLTTSTDSVGIGTTDPSYKLHVVGTEYVSDTLTAGGALGVTGNTTLTGALNANGNVTLGNSTSDSLTFVGRIANGTSLTPDTDLGSDLGTETNRFNNLWVANINSNSSQAFSGQTTFSYPPQDTTTSEASVFINPAASITNGQLLGFGVAGYQKALIDSEGDMILGYSNTNVNPTRVDTEVLSLYGHNGTKVAYIDTSGNLNMGTGLTSSGALSMTTSGDFSVNTNQLFIESTNSKVGIGTTTPAQTLTVLGDLASSVATGVEGLKLTDTTDVTKLAMKWTGTGVSFDMPSASTVNKLSNGGFDTNLTGWNLTEGNWWLSGDISATNAVVAYQPMGSANLGASYSNLANPGTYDATLGVAPTWDAVNGWKGDGTQWLNTGYVPVSGFSVLVKFSNVSSGISTGTLIGQYSASSNRSEILPNYSNTVFYSSGGYTAVAPKLLSGVLGIAGNQPYRNGVADGGTMSAWGTTTTNSLYIFNRNGETNLLSAYVQAVSIYNNTLTPAQVLAVTNAMNTIGTGSSTSARNTTNKYAGGASAQIVAINDTKYLQSVTLPDTSIYNLTAFAYTDGSAVTTADLDLYYDSGELTTTFTSVGNGWYKLSGTLTGVASAKNYGVRIHASKTVYVDNLSLFTTSGAGTVLAVSNSTTGLGGLNVESTTTLNSGLASLQALIVKGFSGQTANLTEWQDSTGTVLASISPTGGFTSSGNLDLNGTVNDIAGTLNLSGNALTSSGALSITPLAGTNLNIALSGTGDFKVNTNDLVVDTSGGNVGIGTTTPTGKLNVVSTTEQLRLGYDSSNYWSNTVGISGGLTMQGVGTGGSLTLSPTAGQNVNIALSGTGDFVVNSNDLVVDTSSGFVGIGTAAPTALLDLAGTSGVDAFRLTNSGSKVLGLSYGTNSTTFDQTSTDPTNKLLNSTFDSDLTSWSEVPSYTLNDQFTTSAPTTLVSGGLSAPTPSLGSEIFSNAGLEAPYTAGLANGWTKMGSPTTTEETTIVNGGTSSQKIVGAFNEGLYGTPVSFTTGNWYATTTTIYPVDLTNFLWQIWDGSNMVGFSSPILATGAWRTVSMAFRATNTGSYFRILTNQAGTKTFYLDDTSLKPLTLSSLFTTTTEATANKIISAGVTLTAGTQAGLVLNADDTYSNFIIAYHDGTKVYFEKNVGGTYSSIFTAVTATYVANAQLKVIKLGNVYQVVYNNVLIGSGTVSDAGIVAGTKQGLFSTLSTNSFTNFLITTNLDGTSAEPTGGTRTVVDTQNLLSVTGGQLSFAGGKTSPAFGDPGLWYPVVTRATGRILTGQLVVTSGHFQFGFDVDQIQDTSAHSFNATIGGTGYIFDNSTNIAFSENLASGTYNLAVVLRTTGSFYYIKGGVYTNWTLLWSSSSITTANLYPGVDNYNSVFTADNIRIPTSTWLPTPLAYDDFASADMTSKATGPDDQTTPALAWTGGSDAGGVMTITPTLETDLWDADAAAFTSGTYAWTTYGTNTIVNVGNALEITYGDYQWGANNYLKNSSDLSSDLTVGNWYQYALDAKVNTGTAYTYLLNGTTFATPISVGTFANNMRIFRANHATNDMVYFSFGTGQVITIDNTSLKPLTLSSLFSTVSTSDADVIADANVTLTAGTQAGLVLNLDSTSSPANFVIAYHDGTKVYFEKNLGGTYSSLFTAVSATYVPGATLRVIKDGLNYRVYYNNVLIGTAALNAVTDANILSGTKHGLFSTYSTNSFDNFTLWPRGSSTTKFTSAPFEELVATRNTTTKYNNSTASVQLVAGGTDANYVQSVNVADTQTYNLIAYAYTTGAVVSASDLSLYYDTGTLTTTYTPMGGTGWYKLVGTLTGVASAKDYGVRVKAGKTVYVDEMHLQVGTGTNQTMYVLNSNTGVTGLNVQGLVNGTLSGVATFSKAGTISDSDFTLGGVSDGMMGIDTTNHRIYFRENGAWSYSAKAGGFQIPKEEVLGLSTGDYLLPYVDTFMSDGAVHGMYQKFDLNKLLATQGAVTFVSDVTFLGKTVFNKDTAGTAIISTYSNQVDVKFTNTYDISPIITMNLVIDSTDSAFIEDGQKAYLTNVSPTGFTIMLPSLAMRDFMYKWIAIPIKEKNVTKSPVIITPTIIP